MQCSNDTLRAAAKSSIDSSSITFAPRAAASSLVASVGSSVSTTISSSQMADTSSRTSSICASASLTIMARDHRFAREGPT